jgi:hypothetical protein
MEIAFSCILRVYCPSQRCGIHLACEYFTIKAFHEPVKIDRITRAAAISEILQSLRLVSKMIQDYSHEVRDGFGITGPQLSVLKTIAQNEGLNLSVLAEKMYLHPSTVSGLIDRLEKKGYLKRQRPAGPRNCQHRFDLDGQGTGEKDA